MPKINSKMNLNMSYYDSVENNYSDSLSTETVELQRKIYLPLLPLEKDSDMVRAAYRYLDRYYWQKDDKYKAMIGNFYAPLLFPMTENTDSQDIILPAPDKSNFVQAEEQVDPKSFVVRNYMELVVPRDIILQFSNLIPIGTKFNISFVGGSSMNTLVKIESVAQTVPIPNGEFDDSLYETNGMSFSALVALVRRNLKKIEKEEERRRKEEEEYERKRQIQYSSEGILLREQNTEKEPRY